MSPPPLVIVDDAAVQAATAAEMLGAGWAFGPVNTGPLVARVTVTEARSSAQAVMHALRGGGLLVLNEAPPAVLDDLVEDLARIGPVRHRRSGTVELDPGTWQLLHLLARGTTVAAAARTLHLAVRTAERRLGTAQRDVGVTSRAELMHWLRQPDRIPSAADG